MSEPHYLLAIAIGPVQDFIAASRKARDLEAGSRLLSDLSRAAAELLRDHGAELIFPTDSSLGQEHAVANKLLVSITGDADTIAGLARAARQHVIDTLIGKWNHLESGRLHDIRDTAIMRRDPYAAERLKRVPRQRPERIIDLPRQQLGDFLEWYAAWAPYDPSRESGDGSYQEARKEVERLLAGRKATREFWPAYGIDGQPKSALDPSRESVIKPNLTPDVREKARRALRLRDGEHLDAVSVIKRLDGQDDNGLQTRFVSTSRVAIDPFIRAVDRNDALMPLGAAAWGLRETDLSEMFETKHPNPDPESGKERRNPLHHFRSFPYDSQLVYETSPAGARVKVIRWLIDQGKLPNGTNPSTLANDMLSDEHRKLVTAAERIVTLVGDLKGRLKDELGESVPELPAYYAVLLADGDRMGAALNKLTTKRDHQDFSTELGQFATDAGDIIREHYGAMIYAGGDDVLAFLPLDTALPCADKLQRLFSNLMKNSAALHGKDIDPLPTLSVGVAIGHYAEHLQIMLDRARNAEREAKKERNSLAVSFGAHSGGGQERIVAHSWNVDPLASRWAKAIEFHRHDIFPDGAAYELEALHRTWRDTFLDAAGNPRPDNPSDPEGILRLEVERILKRKQPRRGTEDTKKDLLRDVRNRLTWKDGEGGSKRELKDTLRELRAFVDEVIIARRIYGLLLDDGSGAVTRSWNKDGARVLLNKRKPVTNAAAAGGGQS